MFWIFGVNATLISKIISTTECPNCREIGSINISIYQGYFNLVFTPTFPLLKKSIITCASCKKEFPFKKLPNEIKSECDETKSKSKTPWWTFSGLFLLILIIPYIIYLSKINKENKLMYFEHPEIGDVYRIEFKNKEFSYCKIIDITNDTLYFSFNSFKSHKLIELSEKDKVLEKNFSKEKVPFTKEELYKLLKSNDIYSISRD